ncbi:MAG: carboxypeptidase regulatory-like domain-containing protein, partial [Deltaproteobacteria bacterium]|nr:carboxypeptidase regulatory-like domain-containing protein [Deltaproteobacteria bacterium]
MIRYVMTMVSVMILCAAPVWAQSDDEQPTSLDEADAAIEKAMVDAAKPFIEGEEATTETEEEESRLRFSSAAPGGETGLMRVMEAGSTDVWTIRLSLHGGFFSSDGGSGFLNYLDQDDYSESYVTSKLSLAWTPLPYMEAFMSLRASSNKNSFTRPQLLQTQGDLEIGAKGFYPVLPYLGIGLNLAVGFVNGIGGVTPDFGGTNLRTSALISFDVRGVAPEVPLRIHFNAGFIMENTEDLEGNRDLNYIEQFALRVNRYHRVSLGFGLDAPLPYADPVAITPFLEYSVQLPIGISDVDLAAGSLGPDTGYANVVPMYLTPGFRVTYLKDITFDFAVDIGIGGEKAYLEGVPSTPPYTIWFGLSYCFDPSKRSEEKIIEKIIEKEKIVVKEVVAPVTTGRIKGRVINAVDQSAIASAIVSFTDSEIPPVATEEMEGKYETYNLTAGMVKLTAAREGFKPMTLEAEVKAAEITLLDFALEPEIKKGTISGTVVNEKDQPMLAKVEISGPAEINVNTGQDTGAFASEVPEGTYAVKVSAEGYLAKGRRFEIKKDKTVM